MSKDKTGPKLPKLFVGAAVIAKQCEMLHQQGKTLQNKAHTLALSTMMHVWEHGDTTVIMRLIQSMPEMARTNGLRAWFEAFAPVKFAGDGQDERCLYVKKADAKPNLSAAHAKPFWKFSANEGKPYEPLDMDKFIDRMVKTLRTDTEKTGVSHAALIDAIMGASAKPLPAAAASNTEVQNLH